MDFFVTMLPLDALVVVAGAEATVKNRTRPGDARLFDMVNIAHVQGWRNSASAIILLAKSRAFFHNGQFPFGF